MHATVCMYMYLYVIIISILMFSLLGHRPSLWITHKENGPYPTTRAQCGLVGANTAGPNGFSCLPKHVGARNNKFLVTHLMTDQTCLTSAIARRNALTAGPSSSSSSLRIMCIFLLFLTCDILLIYLLSTLS
jgi:hypothetical protein